MALVLEHVEFSYPVAVGEPIQALRHVSLSVDPGDLVLVLGVTGSGKSTLLQIAAGLVSAASGKAEIDGQKLSHASARGTVGLVFQDAESQLFADTVLDDVAFGPLNLGSTREEALCAARTAIRRVGLDPEAFARRSPFALSGGEARRIAIAGVLAMSPRYLLLDEPTAGLDARGRTAVREIVRAERERCGIVVVDHSAQEYLGEADRVLLLSAGEPAFEGEARELIAQPSAFVEAGLLAPEVLRVQELAAAHGARLPEFSADACQAAQQLAGALGGT